MGMPPLTAAFVQLLLDWSTDDTRLMDRCRLLLLDGLAVSAAGAQERGPRLMVELAQRLGGEGDCTVIGSSRKATPWDAARINGMAMHVLDYEPMWNPANHALSPLLPALLALAELREAELRAAQGPSLLRALAIGIEAQARLRLSSRQFAPAQLSMHPPGVVGAIASALACASMLELSTEQATMAVGIAASRTAGILANVGSHTKALHCGDGAAHGLEAALLAQAGFSANEDALAGPRGWGAAYFGTDFDPEPLLAPLGDGKALVPGPAWKLFPSQFGTHFGITAALDARAQLGDVDPAQVERVELRVPPMPYIDRPRPGTGLEGKFSWQYTATVALLDGVVNLASFSDGRRHRDDIEALLDRFVLVPDERIPGRFDAMHVELQVLLKDGRSVLCTCDAPLGSWGRPIDSATVERKAFELLAAATGELVARQVTATIVRTPGEFGLRRLLALLQ